MGKVYFQYSDGKSGHVSTVRADFPLFRYEDELLKRVVVYDPKRNPNGIDLFKDKFCALCWRKTEMHKMAIKMVTPAENKHNESNVAGKYSGEVNSLQYDLTCLREYIEDFKLGTRQIPSEYQELFEEAANILAYIFKAIALPHSVENHLLVDDLLTIHAPNYVPVDIPSGTSINKWELLFCIMEQLCVSGWTQDKIPAISALSRKPSSKLCSEHNQSNGTTSRQLYQRDIKFKNRFQNKLLETLIFRKIVSRLLVEGEEWLWSKPVSSRVIEQVRREVYNGIMLQPCCTELILNMHSQERRQCEIVDELVKQGLAKRGTARQIVSNTIKRNRVRQMNIYSIITLKNAGKSESEISKTLGISVPMVKRLYEARDGTLLAQSNETTQWDK